jgi:predicted MFS family arabinose efflux permease
VHHQRLSEKVVDNCAPEIFAPWVKQPLLPMDLFQYRNFWIAVVVGSVGQMSFYALNVLWPTHIQALYTTDNMTVGWMSCANGAALCVGEILTGPLFKRSGKAKLQMILSMAGLCIFCGVMALSDEHHEAQAIAVCQAPASGCSI